MIEIDSPLMQSSENPSLKDNAVRLGEIAVGFVGFAAGGYLFAKGFGHLTKMNGSTRGLYEPLVAGTWGYMGGRTVARCNELIMPSRAPQDLSLSEGAPDHLRPLLPPHDSDPQ